MAKKYKVVKHIEEKGYPINTKEYKAAHIEADKKEKAKYPVGYEKLKQLCAVCGKNELIGDHSHTGHVIIEEKVPPSLRSEVAYHETEELKAEKRLTKRKKK